MIQLMMHMWVAYPALVVTMVVVWGLLLYVAWKVVEIGRWGDE